MVEWELHDDSAAVFELDDQRTFEWGSSEYIEVVGGGVAEYDGPYEITPASAAQVVPIAGMLATDDVTINPIPSNYGLITYNGSTITVS